MKDSASKKPSLKTFIQVATNCAGIISAMSQNFGVTRKTIYNWIHADADFAEAMEDARESIMDMVESNMFQLAKNSDRTMLIFLAKTLGKNRGYVERVETVDRTVKFGEDDIEDIGRYGKAYTGRSV